MERGECRRSGAGKSAVDARILDEPGEEVDLQDIVLASTFGFVSRPVTSLDSSGLAAIINNND